MIYAVGDNQIACRLAGVRVWQVLLAVYVLSGLFAAVGGLLFSGTTGSVGVDQTNSYPAPVGRRHGDRRDVDPRRHRRLQRDDPRRLILTVLNRLLLRLDVSEAFKQMLYGVIVLALAWLYVRLTGQKSGER